MSAIDTIKEALREYVGDGDGADQEVFREAFARVYEDGLMEGLSVADSIYPPNRPYGYPSYP